MARWDGLFLLVLRSGFLACAVFCPSSLLWCSHPPSCSHNEPPVREFQALLGRRMLEPQQVLQEGDPGKFPLSFRTLSPCWVERGLVVSIVLSTGRGLRWKGRTHTQLHRGQDPVTPLPQFPTALLMRSQLTWGTPVTCLLPQDPAPCSCSQVPAFRPLPLLCHHLVSAQS